MKRTSTDKDPIRIFVSYAHEDRAFKEELIAHLSSLQREGLIEIWDDRQIVAGTEWDADIRRRLEQSQIVMLLVSSDAMASEYIHSVEIKEALDRYHEGKTLIIPVLIRPCDWSALGIDQFLGVPRSGVPISSAEDRDRAYLEVVEDVRTTVQRIDELLDGSPRPKKRKTSIKHLLAYAAGFVVLVLAGFFLKPYLMPEESRTISGFLLTYGGRAESNTSVELYQGSERIGLSMTNEQGQFTFEDVPEIEEARVEVRINNDVLIDSTFNVAQALEGNELALTLPPGDAPFRVTYYHLNTASISRLLQGNLGELFPPLEGAPVLQNQVWQDLNELQETFAEETYYQSIVLDKRTGLTSDPLYSEPGDNAPPILGGNLTTNHNYLFVDYAEFENAALPDSVIDFITQYPWYIKEYDEQTYLDQTYVEKEFTESLWRFSKPGDFAYITPSGWYATTGRFYQHLTQETHPDGFGITVLYNPCFFEDPCSYKNLSLMFILPEIRVQVLQIENISNEPMRFNDFIFRETPDKVLRNAVADSTQLLNAATKSEALYPRVLMPQESIILPLRIYFEYDGWIFDEWQDSLLTHSNQPPQVRNEGIQYQTLVSEEWNQTYQCPIFAGLTYGNTAPPTELWNPRFVYGTSISLVDIEVEQTRYPVRQLAPGAVFAMLYGRGGVGSCPYIFTNIPETDIWLNEGHILYQVSAPHRERYDEIKVRTYYDKIQIRELDPETSYIDHLMVVVKNPDGEQHHIPSRHPLLNKNDGEYLVLDQGDVVELTFDPIPEAFWQGDVYIRAKGYYVPYTHGPVQ